MLLGTGRWGAGIDLPTLRGGLLVFLGYYLGAQLGLALTFQPHPVSVMWPPNSILLAALVLSPCRAWWFLLLCALPAHLITELQGGVPWRMILCWFVSNSSEALIGAVSTRWLAGPTARFDRLRGIGMLFLGAGLVGPFLSSFLDSGFVSLNHWGQQGYWEVWRMRFCSNVFSALVWAPVIVTFGTCGAGSLRKMSLVGYAEAGFALAGLLVSSLLVFCWQEAGPATIPSLLYVPLPFLLWAAIRLGPTVTSAAILSVALLAIWGAVHGHGPFGSHSPEQNALSIQVFFVVTTITLMFLSTSIGERKSAQERFTKVFQSSPDAMLISRLKDGQIVEVNERWEKTLGYRKDETVGRAVFDLNICTSEANHEAFVGATAAGEHFQGLELCLRKKGGDLLHTMISADVEDIGGEPCWIFIIRDFTDHKRAEEAQQNLAHASRLAVVGELTAMVAHEVNQPLGAILSNAEAAEMLLEMESPPLNEIRQILSDIRKNDLRADEAIRRIRGLLRKQEMQMQPLNLSETIADVLRFAAGDALRRRVMIRREGAQNLPLVFGDPVHLQHVLLNLIVNGMDAMAETLEGERRLTVEASATGDGEVEVAVSDCGHGIGAEKMPRIFDSFFTTKKEGMGLGLSMARSIIEAHGGRIRALNNASGGATFHFTVRVAENGTGNRPPGVG